MEARVGNKYRLGRKIGSGSFGEIYLGRFYFVFLFFLIEFLLLDSGVFVFTDLVLIWVFFLCVCVYRNKYSDE